MLFNKKLLVSACVGVCTLVHLGLVRASVPIVNEPCLDASDANWIFEHAKTKGYTQSSEWGGNAKRMPFGSMFSSEPSWCHEVAYTAIERIPAQDSLLIFDGRCRVPVATSNKPLNVSGKVHVLIDPKTGNCRLADVPSVSEGTDPLLTDRKYLGPTYETLGRVLREDAKKIISFFRE